MGVGYRIWRKAQRYPSEKTTRMRRSVLMLVPLHIFVSNDSHISSRAVHSISPAGLDARPNAGPTAFPCTPETWCIPHGQSMLELQTAAIMVLP